ncbi:MAG: hypothetical protein AAF533_07610 [Acidobacteriota bacterium]
MTQRVHRLPVLLLAGAATLAWPALGVAAEQQCERIVIADPGGEGGEGGEGGQLVVVEESAPPRTNSFVSTAMTGVADAVTALTFDDSDTLHLVDPDADPSGLGPDAGGGAGPGAVFRVDETTGGLDLVTDGRRCGYSITNCGPTGVLVDPVEVAWDPLGGLMIVDPDADPSGFGGDRAGAPGHGGVFMVLPDGTLELLSDGSAYPGGVPDGRDSVFEDPVALAFSPIGETFVIDRSARPVPGDGVGAVFGLGCAGGLTHLIAARSDFRDLRDVAVESTGTLLVLDGEAGGNGRVYRIDPRVPAGNNVQQIFTSDQFVSPVALALSGSGRILVLDAEADPFEVGARGALFELTEDGRTEVISSAVHMSAPSSLVLRDTIALDSVSPNFVRPDGEIHTLTILGGPFNPGTTVEMGEGVTVIDVRPLDFALEIDLLVAEGAEYGPRDVIVRDPELGKQGFHCDLFEVSGGLTCVGSLLEPIGATLRLSCPSTAMLRLAWSEGENPCLTTSAIYRGFSPKPGDGEAAWPNNPEFVDITPRGGVDEVGMLTVPLTEGRDEYFLIVPVGPDGDHGSPGHYGR